MKSFRNERDIKRASEFLKDEGDFNDMSETCFRKMRSVCMPNSSTPFDEESFFRNERTNSEISGKIMKSLFSQLFKEKDEN